MVVKHRAYFDGSVQSLELQTGAGRATVGVIEPGSYRFDAEDEERLHVIAGTLRARHVGGEWSEFKPGEVCVVPPGTSFDVAAGGHVAYLCFYVRPGTGKA